MPIDLNAWLTSPARAQLQQAQETRRLRAATARAHDVEMAHLVVAHPGWQHFLNLLAAECSKYEQLCVRLRQAMEDETALGEVLTRQKMALREARAALAALRWAQALVPDLLAQPPGTVNQSLTEPAEPS